MCVPLTLARCTQGASLTLFRVTFSVCACRSEPYDPYLPRGGSSTGGAGPAAGNSKTAAIQQQIDDTVGIMRENITKVAERGERLDSLQDKTGTLFSRYQMVFVNILRILDNLAVSAQGFRRGANRVRKV